MKCKLMVILRFKKQLKATKSIEEIIDNQPYKTKNELEIELIEKKEESITFFKEIDLPFCPFDGLSIDVDGIILRVVDVTWFCIDDGYFQCYCNASTVNDINNQVVVLKQLGWKT